MKQDELMKNIEENNGYYFEGDYLYTKNHCDTCDSDFVLEQHDNPAFDSPRVYEFPNVCDSCLYKEPTRRSHRIESTN